MMFDFLLHPPKRPAESFKRVSDHISDITFDEYQYVLDKFGVGYCKDLKDNIVIQDEGFIGSSDFKRCQIIGKLLGERKKVIALEILNKEMMRDFGKELNNDQS